MQDRSTANPGDDPGYSAAATVFRQAAASGREVLDRGELAALLSGIGIRLAEDGASAEAAPPVEVRISLNSTREFGMVISAGLGGLDAELDEANFRRDRASIYAVAELTDGEDFLCRFRRTLAYQKLAGIAQRSGKPAPDAVLKPCFENLLALTGRHSPDNPAAAFVIRALELNPVQVGDALLVRQARCEFGVPTAVRLGRPVHKIDKLIHPASIGIIGVSASGMNFGRIILRNLMGSGYRKERMCIIRPGETEIDGVKCVESLKALDHKLDLLIVAVAASAVY